MGHRVRHEGRSRLRAQGARTRRSGPGFQRAVREVATDTALLHLRMASPRSPVVLENTHPFGDRQMAFAHNGDFLPVDCLDGTLDTSRAAGDTDSERFYLGIRRRVDDGARPHVAIMATAAELMSRARGYASLNCLLLTPRRSTPTPRTIRGPTSSAAVAPAISPSGTAPSRTG
ncbi:class II glutamine amidotransferase [Streptomyces sp. M19]